MSLKANYNIKELEVEDFPGMKERMIKTGIFEVMLCNGCDHLRNNKLGIYCRNGTRRIRKLDEKIVCLDCAENRLERLEISKDTFESLEKCKVVKTTF